MLLYWQLFLAFLIPGLVGYGGGPASIPLIQNEVVDKYGWLSNHQFGELLAVGNSLPGPIATKLAGYIGYEVGGVWGACIALFATIAPSLLAMIMLLGLLYKYRHSPRVKRMTGLIRPTIAVLLGLLALDFFQTSWQQSGLIHTLILVVASYLTLEKWQLNPALVIVGCLLYGALFLA